MSASMPVVASPSPRRAPLAADRGVELTVLMPCLNEAETLVTCIGEATAAMRQAGVRGEVLVADNGSSDGSVALARAHGARVAVIAERGYGAAVMGGVIAARGRFLLIGDADGSYDFRELPGFLRRLRQGCDLVMGCRLPAGGGRILRGAMPWKHRWIGNPVLSSLGRFFFAAPVHDFHCGLRGIRRDAALRLGLRCTGMELASEMVVKATLAGLRIAEVPITLRPDGRSRRPHLRSFKDGWRHLRFMLLFSPRWLFLVPSLVAALASLAALLALARGPVTLGSVTFDTNTLIVAAVGLVTAVQAGLVGILAQAFAVNQGLIPTTRLIRRLKRFRPVELGLVTGLGLVAGGLGWLMWEVEVWRRAGFGNLPTEGSLRIVVPAVTAFALGVQLFFWGFALAVLDLSRHIRLRGGGRRR